MPTDRPTLRGPVDEDIFERWHAFAARHNLDMGPLLQAIGYQLNPDLPAHRLPPWLRQAVRDAAAIRSARKDRRPRD